jgi:hypothetical protein
MFDVYYTHNDIGAKMLKTIDTDEHVIMLVRHHQPWDDFHVEGMEFLKKADSLN